MTYKEYKNRFLSISKMIDEVKQAEEINDICYEAEILLEEGHKDVAIKIFKKILNINLIEEDLKQTALKIAKEKLIALGVITLKSLDALKEKFMKEFSSLPKGPKLLAIAKTIWREKGESITTSTYYYHLIIEAEKMMNLSKKDIRLKLELEQRLNISTNIN